MPKFHPHGDARDPEIDGKVICVINIQHPRITGHVLYRQADERQINHHHSLAILPNFARDVYIIESW